MSRSTPENPDTYLQECPPSFWQVFQGFEPPHLNSMLGVPRDINFFYQPSKYTAWGGLIGFDILAGRDDGASLPSVIASIRGMIHDDRDPKRAFGLFSVESIQQQVGGWRGLRVAWINRDAHRDAHRDERDCNDLFLYSLQLVPLAGETQAYVPTWGNDILETPAQEPVKEISRWGPEENMHVFAPVCDEHGLVVGLKPPVDGMQVNTETSGNNLTVRVLSDGRYIMIPVNLVLPRRIKVNPSALTKLNIAPA